MKIQKQKGFTTLEMLLVIIILAIVGFTGYYVYHSKQQTDKTLNAAQSETSAVKVTKTSVNSFETCQKATGSKIETTYPEICVTKSGQKFTQPTSSIDPQKSQTYLAIKDWGVEFPVSEVILDAYYTPNSNGTSFSLRVHSLDSESDCKNSENSIAALFRMTKAEYDQAKNSNDGEGVSSNGVTIGDYYYVIEGAQYNCAQTDSGLTLAQSVRAAFISESPHIQAQ